ncbi:MAG: RusA family crossover junction endodeoxyribonuclease [Christensenella sp.]|nr:RusA family crossover junction endodeoxyribonuclease [Christensenella sp.]MEA5004707.1 RusA family crossover junction endodeoxyribonuclease [Christensenella sp.]
MMTPEAAMQCIGQEKPEAMRTIEFWVEGDPKGKERPRANRFGRPYTPKNTLAYEKKIREACEKAMPNPEGGISGAGRVRGVGLLPDPKIYHEKGKGFYAGGKELPGKDARRG